MEILKGNGNINLLLNTETDFLQNLGSEENLQQFEGEVLRDIINPIENYEVVRYIHEPYEFQSGLTQCDIWFYFYFLTTGFTYVQDYSPVGISYQENELLLKQTTKSFFRLEFYKTPTIVTNNTMTCEAPTRLNRKLVFSRDLSLPIGEKLYYNQLRGNIHVPVFTGNNYRNKENMYLFWFEDESVLEGTNFSGTTTGNTFFMTAKFYDAKNGSILDFANDSFNISHSYNESNDFYYQVDINKINHTYVVSKFNGTKGTRIGNVSGSTINAIKFYEKGGYNLPTPTPTITPSHTITPTPTIGTSQTPTPSISPTNTITPTMTTSQTPTPTNPHYCLITGDNVVTPGTPNRSGQIILHYSGRVMNLTVYGGVTSGGSSTLTFTVVGASTTDTPNPNSITISANQGQTTTGTLVLPSAGIYNYTLAITTVGTLANNGRVECGNYYP